MVHLSSLNDCSNKLQSHVKFSSLSLVEIASIKHYENYVKTAILIFCPDSITAPMQQQAGINIS